MYVRAALPPCSRTTFKGKARAEVPTRSIAAPRSTIAPEPTLSGLYFKVCGMLDMFSTLVYF